MLKRTLIKISDGFVFRRFEHLKRGQVDTLSYPCGRLVYVSKGFTPTKLSRTSMSQRAVHKRLGAMWCAAKRKAGGEA